MGTRIAVVRLAAAAGNHVSSVTRHVCLYLGSQSEQAQAQASLLAEKDRGWLPRNEVAGGAVVRIL